MIIEENPHVSRKPNAGDFYVYMEVHEPPKPSLIDRIYHALSPSSRPRAQVVLRYRQVITATPWLVTYRDDDPTDPDPQPALKAAWMSTWADYTTQCRCVCDVPLSLEEISALLEGKSVEAHVFSGDPAPEEGEDQGDSYAVSHTEVPADEDDGWGDHEEEDQA